VSRLAPRKTAKDLIDKFSIQNPSEIFLEEMAYKLGALVIDDELEGAEARIVRRDSSAIIRISTRIKEIGQRRFAIGHELGHFIFHIEQNSKACTGKDMINWTKDDDIETEANIFSAELLMPQKFFEPKCDVIEIDFHIIENLAKEFQTSLTATAVRFVKFCPEQCALVCSENGKVRWFRVRKQNFPFLITPGMKLDENSLASNYFEGKEIPDESQYVHSYAWIDSPNAPEEILEHSKPLTSYGCVLSLLWIPVNEKEERFG